MDDYYDYEYTDSDRLDELNCVDDYNRFEEEQVARDMDMGEGDCGDWEEEEAEMERQQDEAAEGEMMCQLQDQEMEDRI